VRPWREMSMHYFKRSGETGTNSTKSTPGHVTPNLCFFNPLGFVGHVLHFGAFEPRGLTIFHAQVGAVRN
jgi:hypothetical protein